MDNTVSSIYQDQARKFMRRVWFTGTTALLKGTPLAYDFTAVTTATGQTATDDWGRRAKCVCEAVALNGSAGVFAGVTTQAYDANAAGQWIDIYEPGSECFVQASVDAVIGDVFNWDLALNTGYTKGKFNKDSQTLGIGAAIALETNATLTSTQSLLYVKLVDVGAAFTAHAA